MLNSLGSLKKTHNLNELSQEDIESEVVLVGWVERRRDHGGVIFIDLRDIHGITQIVFDPENDEKSHKEAHALRSEFVLCIKGIVKKRPDGMINPNLKTGSIEVFASLLNILNTSKTPPFSTYEDIDVSDNIRLKYRYIDLRRKRLRDNIIKRHKIFQIIREYFNQLGFLDIETPFLNKSTPEGARDYLVPSRTNKGAFYALPQSPQLFKQILMVSGFEKYYQIVRCFRDEDLRADRQPEFTQLDVEASFVDEQDIIDFTEPLIQKLFDEVANLKITLPFKQISYQEAMDKYGTDRPDIRFDLELKEITTIFENTDFKVFANIIKNGGMIKALNVKNASSISRKDIDDFTSFVNIYGAKGLAWIRVKNDSLQSPITKFFSEDEIEKMTKELCLEEGDLLFFVADSKKIVNDSLSNLRVKIAKKLNLMNDDDFAFVWVRKFPLMEFDEQEKKFKAIHHPFTSPLESDIELLEDKAEQVRSKAYDLVINGVEVGGGSIRIHKRDMQEKMFSILGISQEEYESKFGFLLEALEYGAPPHGGIAFGLDRLAMIICKEKSIRDVIAFPKTQKGACLMTEAPSLVDNTQLMELALKVLE